MQRTAWRDAVAQCADSKRAQHYHGLLSAAAGEAALHHLSAEQARVLAALFSGSQAMSEALVAHPDWLATSLDPERLAAPRREEGLRRDVNEFLKPALERRDFPTALAQLRLFKQREHLRIAARDLARFGLTPDLTHELSNVADLCLGTVLQICLAQLTERLGSPWHRDADERWQPTQFCVLGLGKLGGQELNYSSDVDLMFVYSEEGEVFKTPPKKSDAGGKGMSSHAFFKRLAEQFLAEVARLAPEGALYRVDLRLRPEGDAGPLVRSLASYEHYYAEWGQTWERLMLIKARCVAGDAALAGEFLELVQSFRYPRYLSERVLGEIAAVKRRIEAEVVKGGELDRNVKLGRGGIREIEFVAQSLQLLHAGRSPFLQGAQTLPTLERLVRYHLLSADEALALTEAYCFLRDVEHRLQMENNLQTHTIPTERKARERLAALMGFARLSDFESARKQHCDRVRRVYDKFLKVEETVVASPLPRSFSENEREWSELLAAKSFRDPAKAVKLLNEFVNGPGYVHVSHRTSGLALQLVPMFLALCPQSPRAPVSDPARAGSETGAPVAKKSTARSKSGHLAAPVLSDPDRVLARLDSFVAAYGARASLYEAWTYNPKAFELLLWLFDRSEFLAELAIRTPDLVDELEQNGRLRRSKTAAEILTDLRHGLHDPDQHVWLRRYFQAEFMRIGLRDILGLADFEQNLTELSALADACLRYALEVVLRRHQFKTAPLAIIGLGKLGGAELIYGSDLDVLFVADDKARNLPALQKLAADVLDLLSTKTELGNVFVTDARLRPNGEKGLLVTTLGAYEDYYRQRAQLWEIQALSRARFVAGNADVGRDFEQLSVELCDFRPDAERAARPVQGLGTAAETVRIAGKLAVDTGLKSIPRSRPACGTPEWRTEIAKMRRRIEQERTPPGQDALAFKTGTGGLVDAEFLAQTFCLAHGWHEPNTLRALERARQSGALPAKDADALLTNYRQLRRLEGILRRWSYEGEAVLPDDPAPQYRVAIRCGFVNAAAFFKALAGWRAEVRRVFRSVCPDAG